MAILTACPDCNVDVKVPSAGVLLLFREDEDGVYLFTCPNCDRVQDKVADGKIAGLLLEAGCAPMIERRQ